MSSATFPRLTATTACAALAAASLLLAHSTGASHAANEDMSAATAVVAPPIQGVNYHGVWGDRDDATRAKILDKLQAAGVTTVRLDVSWAMLQSSGPDSYDMSWGVPRIDKRIAELRARGMKALLLFYWAPEWSTGTASKNGVPRDAVEFGKAAAWAADRWENDLIGIELWNEPDLPDFLANTSVATHTSLIKAAYPRIKAVAPNVTVVAGATTAVKTEWWKQFYELGGADHYDAIGIHPYMGESDVAPNTCVTKYIQYYPCNVDNLIDLMAENGDADKKIWGTEYGWSTHDNSTYPAPVPNWKQGVTEAQQAQYYTEMQSFMAQWPQVEAMFWYNDWEKNTGDAHEDGFGLLRRDFSAKPALRAMECLITGCPTPTPTGSATPSPMPSVSASSSAAPSAAPSSSGSASPSQSFSPTPSTSASASGTASPAPTATANTSPTNTPTSTPTPVPTTTTSPAPRPTPSPTPSPTRMIKPKPAKPGKPTVRVLAKSTSAITVEWSATTDTTHYRVKARGRVWNTFSRQHTISGLEPNRSVTFRVTAKNSFTNKSTPSASLRVKTLPAKKPATARKRASR